MILSKEVNVNFLRGGNKHETKIDLYNLFKHYRNNIGDIDDENNIILRGDIELRGGGISDLILKKIKDLIDKIGIFIDKIISHKPIDDENITDIAKELSDIEIELKTINIEEEKQKLIKTRDSLKNKLIEKRVTINPDDVNDIKLYTENDTIKIIKSILSSPFIIKTVNLFKKFFGNIATNMENIVDVKIYGEFLNSIVDIMDFKNMMTIIDLDKSIRLAKDDGKTFNSFIPLHSNKFDFKLIEKNADELIDRMKIKGDKSINMYSILICNSSDILNKLFKILSPLFPILNLTIGKLDKKMSDLLSNLTLTFKNKLISSTNPEIIKGVYPTFKDLMIRYKFDEFIFNTLESIIMKAFNIFERIILLEPAEEYLKHDGDGKVDLVENNDIIARLGNLLQQIMKFLVDGSIEAVLFLLKPILDKINEKLDDGTHDNINDFIGILFSNNFIKNIRNDLSNKITAKNIKILIANSFIKIKEFIKSLNTTIMYLTNVFLLMTCVQNKIMEKSNTKDVDAFCKKILKTKKIDEDIQKEYLSLISNL